MLNDSVRIVPAVFAFAADGVPDHGASCADVVCLLEDKPTEQDMGAVLPGHM